MKFKEKDFVLTTENEKSPILITVPHGGMSARYGSWLETFFKKRTKPENENPIIKTEKVVLGGDGQILHIVMDVLKKYEANTVTGLLPRCFVDYNRFLRHVAYDDENIRPFYDAYHYAIRKKLEKMLTNHKFVHLLDLHGFGRQPIEGKEFDIILGTNGESSPREIDKFFYRSLKRKYKIFSAGMDDCGDETIYRGDTTNLYYHHKYGIDTMLVEISPKFRSSKKLDSKQFGQELSQDLAIFLKKLDKRAKKSGL